MYTFNILENYNLNPQNIEEATHYARIISQEFLLSLLPKNKFKKQNHNSLNDIIAIEEKENGIIYEIFQLNEHTVEFRHTENPKLNKEFLITYQGEKEKEKENEIKKKCLNGRADLNRFFIDHPLEDRLDSKLEIYDKPDSYNNKKIKGIRDNGLTVRYNKLSKYNLPKRKNQIKAAIMAGIYFQAQLNNTTINAIINQEKIIEIINQIENASESHPLVDIYLENGKIQSTLCNDFKEVKKIGKLEESYSLRVEPNYIIMDFHVNSYNQRILAENSINIFDILLTNSEKEKDLTNLKSEVASVLTSSEESIF